jgi:hypothetical protein
MTEYLLSVRYSLVNFVDNIFWLWLEMSVWFILIFIVSIVILYVLKLILNRFTKNSLWIKQKLIYEYDNIFYLLSLSQYQQELDKKSLGWDPCISAIKPIVNMENPDYVSHKIMIKTNIKQVESLLWVEVISNDIWDKISNFHKKLKLANLYYNIFKILLIFIFIFVISIFVYIFSV